MPADATSSPLLLLFVFTTIGLVCLAVFQWRALRRAGESMARYQRAEEEWLQREERFRTPLEQAEDYT